MFVCYQLFANIPHCESLAMQSTISGNAPQMQTFTFYYFFCEAVMWAIKVKNIIYILIEVFYECFFTLCVCLSRHVCVSMYGLFGFHTHCASLLCVTCCVCGAILILIVCNSLKWFDPQEDSNAVCCASHVAMLPIWLHFAISSIQHPRKKCFLYNAILLKHFCEKINSKFDIILAD